jgi:uncharacterized protein YbjT (DUF2867 family)
MKGEFNMTKLRFAVLGSSGQTGGAVVRHLIKSGNTVQVLARKFENVSSLVNSGAQFHAADVKNPESLIKAFEGVDAVYVMSPPNYMALDLIKDSQENISNLIDALKKTGVKKIVVLSSVGSHLSTGLGNIFTTRNLEIELRKLPIDVGVVRAAWFMENWKSVAQVAKNDGVLPSLLTPLERKIEMVATEDIGRVCAELLTSNVLSQKIELAGPEAVSPVQVAQAFTNILGRPIKAVSILKEELPNVFKGLPPNVIQDWSEMVDGFNSGHIIFEGAEFVLQRGKVSISDSIKTMLK